MDDPHTQAIRESAGGAPHTPTESYVREFAPPRDPPPMRVMLHVDDLRYIAAETARLTREEMTGWDAMFTIAFRGGIAFGLVGFGFWGAWWFVVQVVVHNL